MVCLSKEEGGLGVTNLRAQNEESTQIFNKVDTPWVQLIWEKHYQNGKLPRHIKKGSLCGEIT
jgi:hypothetical protein